VGEPKYRPGVSFRGFPAEALEFYRRLEEDNSKSFWQANKATFESAVKAPMSALCDDLAEFGPFHLFRPYNDLRFAKDRPPYKTAQGAYGEREGGSGYYVQLSSDGLLAAAGYYAMAKDQLERFPGNSRRRHDRVGGRDARGGARPQEVRDRSHRRAEDRSARLRQGPPAHRAVAAQGSDGLSQLGAGNVDALEAGRAEGPRRVGRCRRPVRLARPSRRPEHGTAGRPAVLRPWRPDMAVNGER